MGQAKQRGTFEQRKAAAIVRIKQENIDREQSEKDAIVEYAVAVMEAVSTHGQIARGRAIRAIKRASDAGLLEEVKALYEERNPKDGEVVEKNGVIMCSGIGSDVSERLVARATKEAWL